MNEEVIKYRKRRFKRLKDRGIRADADWVENDHPRDEGGQFTEKGGSSASERSPKEVSVKIKPVPTKKCRIEVYADKLKKCADAVPRDKRWRVTVGNADYFKKEHPNADYRVTAHGSTFAVDDGDIIGVCRHPDDICSGIELMAAAVKRGGVKLDSYSGNHGFYVKCGFEPISWCKFDEQYAPDGWIKGTDKKEPVIFYKYVGAGNVKNKDLKDFFTNVKASEDYDTAKKIRDERL